MKKQPWPENVSTSFYLMAPSDSTFTSVLSHVPLTITCPSSLLPQRHEHWPYLTVFAWFTYCSLCVIVVHRHSGFAKKTEVMILRVKLKVETNQNKPIMCFKEDMISKV